MAKIETTNNKSTGKSAISWQTGDGNVVFEVEHPAEKELRQLVDEERYKAVFESAGDIMMLFDKKGKIIDVNGKSVEISGYAKEEVVGKDVRVLSKILTKKSMARVITNFLKRMAGFEIPPYEIDLIKKNGELLTFEISAQPLRKDGKIIGDLGILRDVSGQTKKFFRSHRISILLISLTKLPTRVKPLKKYCI